MRIFIALFLLSALALPSVHGKYHKAPVTAKKIKGSVIDYMKELKLLTAENERLKKELKSASFLLINHTLVNIQLVADDSRSDMGVAGKITRTELASGSGFESGDKLQLVIEGKAFDIRLKPGQKKDVQVGNAKIKILIDYLKGSNQWLLLLETE